MDMSSPLLNHNQSSLSSNHTSSAHSSNQSSHGLSHGLSSHGLSIFLRLKTFVTSAKRQLGRQEIDNQNKEERTLKLNATEIAALPDLPNEEPSTPYSRSNNNSVTDLKSLESFVK